VAARLRWRRDSLAEDLEAELRRAARSPQKGMQWRPGYHASAASALEPYQNRNAFHAAMMDAKTLAGAATSTDTDSLRRIMIWPP
jgi:hypothetical protein